MINDADRTRTYDWKAPLTNYDVFHEMDGKTYLQSIIDGKHTESPMAQTMGLSLADVDDGYAAYTVTPTEYHYNPIGVVHGGLAATIFDTTLSSAVITQLPVGKVCATVELHVHYLRALTYKTGQVRCEAHTIHVGRQLATAEAKLIGEHDGKIYGHATITCVVMDAPQGDIHLPSTGETRTVEWVDPMIGARQATQMTGVEYITEMSRGNIPPPPIFNILGMRGIRTVERGRVTFGTHIGAWQMNTSGVIHGGLTATLVDSALGCAVHTTMPDGMAYTTSELNVNFVKAIPPTLGELFAEATSIHTGSRIATADCRVTDKAGKLYAHATTTCLMFPMPQK